MSLGRGYQFDRETCLNTVIVLAILFDEARGAEMTLCVGEIFVNVVFIKL